MHHASKVLYSLSTLTPSSSLSASPSSVISDSDGDSKETKVAPDSLRVAFVVDPQPQLGWHCFTLTVIAKVSATAGCDEASMGAFLSPMKQRGRSERPRRDFLLPRKPNSSSTAPFLWMKNIYAQGSTVHFKGCSETGVDGNVWGIFKRNWGK